MHQPFRLKKYSIFNVGHGVDYFSEADFHSKTNNERIFKKVAEKSYRPMLAVLEKCLARFPGFKFSLSITGTFLEQAEMWGSDIIETLKRLVATGRVEIVAETYYHSLAFFYDRDEFEAEVKMHSKKIEEVFGVRPRVFRNTELAYNNELGKWAEEFGFAGVLAEGWDKVLGWKSPDFVYKPAGGSGATKLLLKNYRLSDDVAFRFSDRNWKEFPLTAEKYLSWLNVESFRGPLINLFMDFETFGEHQWADTGIFSFFEELVSRWLHEPDAGFLTVSDACAGEAVDEVSMPWTVTWADTERDLSAWTGNAMQTEGLKNMYALKNDVLKTGDMGLIGDWRKLLASDHAYFMCTKYFNDGDVHAYFSPYDSPYDAFLYYMNAVRDVEFRTFWR
jgi:alpha-amylase